MVAPALEPAGQPHVDQLGLAARRDDDIRGFDIPMDDTAQRRVHKRVRDLQRDIDRLGDGERRRFSTFCRTVTPSMYSKAI